MMINPWAGNGKVLFGSLRPDTIVYTLRLQTEDTGGLLCDKAWTSRHEVYSHFWMAHPEEGRTVTVEEYSLKDYLEVHNRTIDGMNPFWNIGRMEFMKKWYDHCHTLARDN